MHSDMMEDMSRLRKRDCLEWAATLLLADPCLLYIKGRTSAVSGNTGRQACAAARQACACMNMASEEAWMQACLEHAGCHCVVGWLIRGGSRCDLKGARCSGINTRCRHFACRARAASRELAPCAF
eukprot:329259-Chlamydomonas_euryale.AAC.8